MRSLEKQGYIFTATYNRHRMDQTKWYTINYDKIREFEKDAQLEPLVAQCDLFNESNRSEQDINMSKAIPKTTTETTTETTTKISKDILIPFADIIHYLNEKTNSNYKPTTVKTKTHIRARWQEGFRLPDFQKVIDIKAAEWLHDAYWKRYLR